MSDRLNATTNKRQNSGSIFKVTPVQPIGFAVQAKSAESVPASKAELWESYQQAKQLNQGTHRSPSIQAKLSIGEPGDKYEQQADSMAAQVMQMPEPGLANSNTTNSVQTRSIQPIQRVCSECQDETKEESKSEEDSDRIQAKEQQGQLPELISIQRKVNSAEDPENGFDLENQLNGSKGGGSPLNDEVRGFMEPRFGTDFSGVRVHTGSDAVQMNGQLNAQAFAHGSDIYFGAGKSPGNNELTAHELTHVVQQTGKVQSKLAIDSLGFNQIMRDASDEQTKNVSVSLASDKEANDIGHSWIMIQKPDGSRDSYGFWPVKMNWLFYPTLGWAKGCVKHPDTAHRPNAVFTRKTTLKGLEKGINYAGSQSASSYHVLAFNCSTFARTMFEKATGETPPSGGLAIDSPNELADEITKRNFDQGLTAMGEPLPKNIPSLAPRYSLPSSPPPPTIQHKKVNVSEGNSNSCLDINTHELTHSVQKTGGVQTNLLIMRQEASTLSNTPVSSVKPVDSTSEAFKTILDTHWFWMKVMLETFKKLDKNLLGEMQKIVDTVPGIYHERSRIAIEAALRVEFSAASIEWLKTNIKPDGKIDQVAEVRDFMGVDAFDKSSNSLLTAITQEIQNIYSERNKNERDEQSKAGKSKITYSTDSPVGAEDNLKKLKILSPLAEIQLRAVMNASADLASGVGKPEVDKATKLPANEQWCGAFAHKSYDTMNANNHDLKQKLIDGETFWSTLKLRNFFTYGNLMASNANYIWANSQWMTPQAYHLDRGSVRKWIPNSEIAKGASLDIRPGDIINLWNHGSDADSGDHVQMVQSWEPTTKTLFTIAGNDGGYRIDNRPPSEVPAPKAADAHKIKKIQDATGFTLTHGDVAGAIGVNFHDLSDEVEVKRPNIAVPYETKNETPEQTKYRKEKEQQYKNAVLAQLKKSKNAGKTCFVSAIGRPSLIDTELHNYSYAKTSPKAPPKDV